MQNKNNQHMASFPFYQQTDQMDCGPTCLRMIAKYYGRTLPLHQLRAYSETTREGSSLRFLSIAAEQIGFRTLGVKVSWLKLLEATPFPCLIFWQQSHFIVLYKVKKNKVFVADPARGLITYTLQEFLEGWIDAHATEKTASGIALLLEPTPRLQDTLDDEGDTAKGFSFLLQYVKPYRSFMMQLGIGLLLSSLLQLIAPFFTQSIVDIGIQHQDMHFIYLMLIAQTLLFLGSMSIQIMRSWLLLHVSSRMHIALISDFFMKLMALPIAFFDAKVTGDLIQRMRDHDRIKNLLTKTSLSTLFSVIQLLLLMPMLAFYSLKLCGVYLVGSTLYVGWIVCFLQKRKDLDYKAFTETSKEQSKVMEIINGMQEIKLHNAEQQKRWEWEYIQARLCKIKMKSLKLDQIEDIGAAIIQEFQGIIITILAAQLVIEGKLTLGMMMAVSYILGQLKAPVGQLVDLIYALQDTSIALERLADIHHKRDEKGTIIGQSLPEKTSDLVINKVSFRYQGKSKPTLNQLSLVIPVGCTTAIVGLSGSGKTTLMKLLLQFYEPQEGAITVGSTHLKHIAPNVWRNQCGVVMQEGVLFNATIAENIALGVDSINKERLLYAAQMAHVHDFVNELPLGYHTKVGSEGVGISTGEKQRLLIARAIYKNPKYLFFDEATSALDARNEWEIMHKLYTFFEGRTTVIIAHRLSTVQSADQIVVLEQGSILEQGNHQALIDQKGRYFNLVKNQLAMT